MKRIRLDVYKPNNLGQSQQIQMTVKEIRRIVASVEAEEIDGGKISLEVDPRYLELRSADSHTLEAGTYSRTVEWSVRATRRTKVTEQQRGTLVEITVQAGGLAQAAQFWVVVV